MTSHELLDALRETGFPQVICTQIDNWMGACDLVKYARQSPQSDHCATAISLARAIISESHQHALVLRSPPGETSAA